jgi:hypothetical protein
MLTWFCRARVVWKFLAQPGRLSQTEAGRLGSWRRVIRVFLVLLVLQKYEIRGFVMELSIRQENSASRGEVRGMVGELWYG